MTHATASGMHENGKFLQQLIVILSENYTQTLTRIFMTNIQ